MQKVFSKKTSIRSSKKAEELESIRADAKEFIANHASSTAI
jgi:hypothetical protein